MDERSRGSNNVPASAADQHASVSPGHSPSRAQTGQMTHPLPSITQRFDLGLPLARKRAATLITTGGGSDNMEAALLSSSSGEHRTGGPTSPFCVCAPEVRVPRPRNAFMLYRQYYQAAVCAENPGMTNPDISKVIGRQWRAERPEVKADWEALAEKEKLRHQQQYPHYKYQPRRKGKGETGTSPVEERCGRCGRRILMTPSTPGTPFVPNLRLQGLPPISSAMAMTPMSAGPSYRPQLFAGPQMMASFGVGRNQSLTGPSEGLFHSRPPSLDEVSTPLSPSVKRRRIGPSPPGFGSSLTRNPSLPGQMNPPPLATSQIGRGAPDTALTLPPLQTAESKSVEAMIMSISLLDKVKLLSKISPGLQAPGPASPPYRVRGAIVAIDGRSATRINQITARLAEELTHESANMVRVFEAPLDWKPAGPSGPEGSSENPFAQYLDSIASWHRRTEELARFITTSPAPSTPQPSAEQPPSQTPNALAPSTPGPRRVPIALIPAYMLTRCIVAAARIPIRDAYSPLAHWQWVASLWRGAIGPDLTVWISEGADEEGGRPGNRPGGVEVHEDAGVLVVHMEDGKDNIEGKVLRRLAFEAGEWVRSITKVEGDGRS